MRTFRPVKQQADAHASPTNSGHKPKQEYGVHHVIGVYTYTRLSATQRGKEK